MTKIINFTINKIANGSADSNENHVPGFSKNSVVFLLWLLSRLIMDKAVVQSSSSMPSNAGAAVKK